MTLDGKLAQWVDEAERAETAYRQGQLIEQEQRSLLGDATVDNARKKAATNISIADGLQLPEDRRNEWLEGALGQDAVSIVPFVRRHPRGLIQRNVPSRFVPLRHPYVRAVYQAGQALRQVNSRNHDLREIVTFVAHEGVTAYSSMVAVRGGPDHMVEITAYALSMVPTSVWDRRALQYAIGILPVINSALKLPDPRRAAGYEPSQLVALQGNIVMAVIAYNAGHERAVAEVRKHLPAVRKGQNLPITLKELKTNL